MRLAVAARRDGTLLAVRARTRVDVGAHSVYPITASLEPMTTSTSLFGAYRFGAIEFDAIGYATNKAPVGGYRGVGVNAAVFATERMMDLLAGELDVDPAQLRLQNLLGKGDFPCVSPAGRAYDTGDYREVLRLGLEHAGYAGLRKEQRRRAGNGKRLGIGIAAYNEHSGMGSSDYRKRGVTLLPGYDGCTVRITPDGLTQVLLSSASSGQGHAEGYQRMVARELGVAEASVAVIEGDTDVCPTGSGTFVSRGAVSIGGSLLLACADLKEKLKRVAAVVLKTDRSLQVAASRVFVADDPATGLSVEEVARAAYLRVPGFLLPPGIEPALEITRYYDPPSQVYPSSAHIAVVEVDPATGQFAILRYIVTEDCGRILDRDIVDGQIVGGVAQGVGTARFERLVYDAAGQLQTASLMDYLVPSATDVPLIEVHHLEVPSTASMTGAKGVGESGTIGVAAALANAVADAAGPAGRALCELPLTEERVARLLAEGMRA